MVIGILAAITIVAYNGIQNKATTATLAADLSSASKKLKLFQIDNGAFPTSLDCGVSPASNSICLKSSNGTSYTTYSAVNSANPQMFCITATNGANNYMTNQDSTPTSGSCSISNFVLNPSFETGLANLYSTTAAAVSRDTTNGSVSGSAAAKVVTTTGYSNPGSYWTLPGPFSGQYAGSVWAWGSGDLVLSVRVQYTDATSLSDSYSPPVTLTGSPQRLSLKFNTDTPGKTVLSVLLMARLSGSVALTYWIDAGMLTQGPSLYVFGDGNSPGWTWNSAVNNSSSTGTPL